MKKSTQKTITNLRLLSAYIKDNVKPSQINMAQFRSNKDGYANEFKSTTDCGTCGCALGWSALIPQLPPLKSHYFWDTDTDSYSLNFWAYGNYYFPELIQPKKYENFTSLGLQVFSGLLTSKKSDVLQRLNNMADGLEDGSIKPD